MTEPSPTPVLHLRSSTDLTGPDRILLDLAQALPRWGYPALVGALSDWRRPAAPLIAGARREGIELVHLPTRGALDVRLIARVARAARRHGVALIHAHEPKGQVVGAAVSRLLGLPLVVTHHGWLSRGLRERIYERAAMRAMRRAAGVVCVSQQGVEELEARVGVGSRVIPNGIAVARLDGPASDGRLRALGIDPGERLVVGAGRLERNKGFADLVEAAWRVVRPRRPTLLILGEGPERAALARRAGSHGIRLVLPGHVDDAPALMARAAAFVLPSLGEGCPVALLEAMAVGCAVVATAVGGVPAMVQDRRSGLLVRPSAPGALARALEEVLGDGDLARRLGEGAGSRIAREYTTDAMAARYAAVYDEVRGERRR